MAIPTLEHQIGFVDAIVLARTEKDSQEKSKYIVEEIIKSRYDTLQVGDLLKVDLSIFELLGYSIHDGQRSIVFLASKKDGFDCIDFLPVVNDRVEYGVNDVAVFKKLTLSELRMLCENIPKR